MQIVPKFLHRLVPLPRPVTQPPKPEPKVPLKPEPKPDHTVDFDDLLRAMGCDL